MGNDPRKLLVWPLAIYLPVSASAVGLLATAMRLSAPSSGGHGFFEIFWAYAPRFPGAFNFVRWIAPGLGLAVLLLLSVAIRSARPTAYLFLFMDVALILVFLSTFLPAYRGLRKRLV